LRGLLEIKDLRRAARHFFALTTAEANRRPDGIPLGKDAADRAIVAGVEVFARGYAPRSAGRDSPSSRRSNAGTG
jgi:hypothetical protein